MNEKLNDKEFKVNELKLRIEKLKSERDAYQLMEDGIKKLEDYNKLAHELNGKAGKIEWRDVIPCMFGLNQLPDKRESGIYKEDIDELNMKIIHLNSELIKLLKRD